MYNILACLARALYVIIDSNGLPFCSVNLEEILFFMGLFEVICINQGVLKYIYITRNKVIPVVTINDLIGHYNLYIMMLHLNNATLLIICAPLSLIICIIYCLASSENLLGANFNDNLLDVLLWSPNIKAWTN